MSTNKIENSSTDISSEDNSVFSSAPQQEVREKPPMLLWIGLGSLFVIALLVVFVLPAVVSEYELPLERRIDVEELVPTPVAQQELEVSPFEEAQRSIQRKEAQDVLAELLEIQGELTSKEVESWGQVAFEEALSQASVGDEYYRTQDFLSATQSYTQGRDNLSALRDSIPTVLTQVLIDAETAFNAGDATIAEEKYSIALSLDPLSEPAITGLDRSRVLVQVTSLLEQSEDLIEDGSLESAQETLEQVLELDGQNETAPTRISEVAAMIREREFSQIMSSGYVFLESGDPASAIAEFEKAASMGINQAQARAAIAQTENEIANVEINGLREIIEAAESAEQWQVAVDNYGKVLGIDPNLTFAIDGMDYATKRARLDSLLVAAIDNPERLSEDDVFQQTLDVYYTGRGIDQPGSVLVDQLNKLEAFLENSQIPIEIRLISDNLTDVTLLRIGNLGLFEQHTVSLKPGRYVAVGKRTGFREVREEFVVGFDQTPSLVVVKCDERVVATNRR